VITGSTGAGTNYQIRIKAHYGSGTDSGEDVYLNSHSRTDFGDVRFTDDDGTTLLDYWMEEYTDSDYAIFWVEVQDDLGTDQTIYIYYGKSGATTTSDGEATFLFFDDFDDGTIDTAKWTVQYDSGGNVTESNGVLTCTGGADGYHAGVYSTSQTYSKCIIETKARAVNSAGTGEHTPELKLNDNPTIKAPNSYADSIFWLEGTTDYIRRSYYTGSWTPEDIYSTSLPDTFHIYRIVKDVSSFKAEYVDPDYSVIASSSTVTISDFTFHVCLKVIDAVSAEFDWVRIRKYIDPEPSHGAWGAEETEVTAGQPYISRVQQITGMQTYNPIH